MILETNRSPRPVGTEHSDYLLELIKEADTSSESAITLGMMYLQGQNVNQDTYKAIFYFKQAIEIGEDPFRVHSLLGFLYKRGAPGIKADLWEAAEHFMLAGGYSDDSWWEAFNLYLNGEIGSDEPLSIKSALHVLSELRGVKNAYAFYLTGEIYSKGLYGEVVNLELAHSYYQEAANLGYKDAEVALNDLLREELFN